MVLEATQNVNPKGQDWDDQPIGVPKNEKGKIRRSHRHAHTPRGWGNFCLFSFRLHGVPPAGVQLNYIFFF